MREVRRALLEADVALDVVRSFVDQVKKHAVGIAVIKSVTPGQMVVVAGDDELIETLGFNADPIDLNAPAPVALRPPRWRRNRQTGGGGKTRA